ncbi:disintegrin and metalloproteinase domain-containing protein 15 isoform X2 [Astyanax mexicanus]|uniref:disintegrin and metalloproteinase domain-containing protein 15 isoform X2 n=1 Tax=Astyanax mexicanus TaxID=7994 RepID=UPI0020CAEC76|nr:disintegrin and metalloproteinase domain-containing protein 15 isoform X2 [Astyanax mexicanus]
MSPGCLLLTVLWRVFLTVLLFECTPAPLVLTQTVLPGNTGFTLLEDGEPASSASPVGVLNTESTPADEDTHDLRSAGITHTSHSVSGRGRGDKPLERTRPFAIVNGRRRSLSDVLQNGHPDTLLCGLRVGDSLLLLELEKNQDLLPKSPNIFYYLPNGTGVSVEESQVTHCYYHGSVRGYPASRVAISTCAGLRGVIFINSSLSFELQPDEEHDEGQVEGSAGLEEEKGMHLLYSAHHLSSALGGCGVSHTYIPPIQIIPHVHRSKRDILSETKYIELVLVADHKEYLNYQRNNKTIIYRMLDVANQVDWFYRTLNVRVALLGLEIWSDQDKILVDKNPTDTLNRFLEWRTRDLLPRLRHDNAQLVMGESFDGTTVGMASQSSMCTKDRSGGVNVDHLVSVLGVASTVAHELGHNLGMSHDTSDRHCECQNEPRLGGCIMEPSTGSMPGQLFSSCSERDLSLSLLHGGGMCLFNVPQPEKLLGGPRCGNLYVEKGEECDCGLLDECNDPCCNASTCKLVPGAQCSSDGICCENCRLRVAGWMCREPLGECDLPEFCTGTSPFCPPNVFLQNGEPCQDGVSYCYSGVCASLDDQCQQLWGANATRAPPVCFSSVNKEGNKYGNCGQTANGSYIPCSNADVHCGRIQCQGGGDRPLLGSNAQIRTARVRLNLKNFTCRGLYFDLGDGVSDPAMVAQGTACAPGKVCLDQRCQDVSVFGVEECRDKCNGHGVCNSNKNCHCDVGWAPPHCQYSGSGGSVDSGPARQSKDSNPTRVALLVIFLFVLPVILLFLAIRFPRCRRSLVCFQITPFSKARQLNRTPATERGNAHNREQVLPLRYQWTPQNDIPLTQAISKSSGQRPAPPTKPLPPDPAPSESKSQRKLTVMRPAAPSKPLPPDPVLSHRQIQSPPIPKPPVPKKPLPADPSGYPAPLHLLTVSEPSGNHTAAVPSPSFPPSAAAAIPTRRAPLPPVNRGQHHPRKYPNPTPM